MDFTNYSSSIHVLDSDLINKIAAGEVVERPASVLKELLENSIDAGSTQIDVFIEEGGKQLIKVSDNGKGMNPLELKLALTEHATSKITTTKDLEKILTLGFRGEALASIASVSQTTIHSYNGQDLPYRASKQQSTIEIVTGEGRSQGTTIEVKNLFYNVPARKKFLRSVSTEFTKLAEVFTQIAITHPEISFRMYKENRELFDLKQTLTMPERILQIFPKLKGLLIPLELELNSIQVSGAIALPEAARQDYSQQYISINKRSLKSVIISKALKDAYAQYLPQGKQPVYFLDYTIDPSEIDINIHPRKLEVKFYNQGQIYSLTKSSITSYLHKSVEGIVQPALHKSYNRASAPTPAPSKASHQTPPYLAIPKSNPARVQQGIQFTKQLLQPSSQSQSFDDFLEDLPNDNSRNELSPYQTLLLFLDYIVHSDQEGIWIINARRAIQRVAYEEFLSQVKKTNQLSPEQLSTSQEVLKFSPNAIERDRLKRVGIELSPSSSIDFSIISAPKYIDPALLAAKITEISTLLQDEVITPKTLTLLAQLTINPISKFDQNQLQKLIKSLMLCTTKQYTPDNKLILWKITDEELTARFKK